MADWVKRAYVSGDEKGIMYLWLKSFAHSRFGRCKGASVSNTPAERRYWSEQAPVVEYLLANAETTVAADPDRPDVIWAFACTSGDNVVHYATVKRQVISTVGEDFGAEIMRDLLGERLEKTCFMTHEIVWGQTGLEMPRRASDQKALWVLDPTWFGRALLAPRMAAA